MSYDIRIAVKVEGLKDKYINIGSPELDSPTYNLGKMFRECMFWDFKQSYEDENKNYQSQYYNCETALSKVIRGIDELENNPEVYRSFEPDNGWGTLENALEVLKSLRDCIYEISDKEEIPVKYLYMCW